MINDIPEGLRVPSQLPLDAKLYRKTEADLSNLGVNNNLAYTYYKGMRVYCIEERTLWEWREPLSPTETKLLTNNFVYPNNLIVNDIVYSNKSYNFFKVMQATDVVIPNFTVGNSGIGVPVYNGTVGNHTNISSIDSDNLSVTKLSDGTIKINQVDFTGIKNFYVNSNYIPTLNFPANGSMARPYPTWEEARTAFIGTGTFDNPQFKGAKIIIQTNSIAVLNPTTNMCAIRFENNSTLTYTGTDLYMFDTEVIYSIIPKGSRQELSRPIWMRLEGRGTITRNNGIGLVRGLGSNRNGQGIFADNICQIEVAPSIEDEIILAERIDYPDNIWDGDITNALGQPLKNIYGSSHKYSLQLPPTIPLVYCKYEAATPFSWGVKCGGKVTFITLANTAVKIDNEILFVGEKFNFLTYGNFISTVSATKMVDFPNHYQPHPNKNYIEGKGSVYCNEIRSDDGDGYATTGVDNFFKFENNGTFFSGSMNIKTNIYVNKFINLNNVTNTLNAFTLSNNREVSIINISNGRYFLDVTFSTFTFIMPSSSVRPFLNKSTSNVDIFITTLGTLASFFDVPVLSGILDFSNDTTAKAAGLVNNSIYFNTTNNSLDKI